jgi:hypothetical protein
MTHSEDRATAIHEAAHAVIGRVLGLPCGRAWLNEDGSGAADSGIEPLRTRAQVGDCLVVGVAGAIAEQLLLKRDPWGA